MQKQYLHFLLFATVIILFTSPFLKAQEDIAAAKQPNEYDYRYAFLFSWKPDLYADKYYISKITDRQNSSMNVTGIGMEYYTCNRSSITGGISLGFDSYSQETTNGEQENSQTEIGVKLGYNCYFMGRDKRVYPFVGAWASYAILNEEQKFTPTTGDESKNEYSASELGVGLTGGAFVSFWEDIPLDFYFFYILGAQIIPEGIIKVTSGGSTTETKGPSRTFFGDCGGRIGARFSF